MTRVIALQSMEHGGPRRRGDAFEVSPQVAEQLARRGLARALGDDVPLDPSMAVGTPSSASPAAPASPQTTAPASAPGALRRGRQPTGA